MTISVKGGHFWKPITPLRGQFCTPVHNLPYIAKAGVAQGHIAKPER